MDTKGSRLKAARLAAGYTSAAAGARRLGRAPSTYAAHENGQNEYGDEEARIYGAAYGANWQWLLSGEGEPGFDPKTPAATRPHRQVLPPPNASAPVDAPKYSDELLPVLGTAVGGPDGRFQINGEIVERVKRPDFLVGVKDAYGLYVEGDSMYPRYKPGELVWVHPHKPPKREDDVVVQLFPEEDGETPEGYIKEFRAWTPSRLILWQWNPATEFPVERPLVKSVHVIVGRR